MSRRNRTNRRLTYGKRQHEVRERRPTGTPNDDWVVRDDDRASPDVLDESSRRDDRFDGYEGWTR